MSSIVLLDTSIFMNILDVPGFNQDRDDVLDRFGDMIQAGDYFLLPMAAIRETGNHIAHLASGDVRRKNATNLYSDLAGYDTGVTSQK